MGAFLGLILGAGLGCIWWSCWPMVQKQRSWPFMQAVADTLRLAGMGQVRPPAFFMLLAGMWLIITVIALLVTASLPIAICLGTLAVIGVWASVHSRAKARRQARMQLWPDVVDQLRSALIAGIGLPDALTSLAQRAPAEFQEAFHSFSAHYRAGQRFDESLTWLKHLLADPVGDRIIESLRMTHNVGGSDVGKVLESMGWYLREDLRLRGELHARQSWTTNSAKLAVAAPWIVLVLMSTRPGTAEAFSTPLGIAILIGGATLCAVAYWIMMRIAQLPVDIRVLR